ncbi:MAG: hypothetical protein Q8O00_14880 [Holophaga sp.]|nr:hypothetical protein [Holophaga sp.]
MATDLSARFRSLVDHLDPSDPEDQLRFFRVLELVKDDAVQELAPRLLLASASLPFRMLAAEAAYYYPNPEWMAPLIRVLRRESDIGVYEVCVRALARIGTAASNEELRSLSSTTHEPVKREMLSMALHASDPDSAFDHHIARLFVGSSNPTVANQAAADLRQIVGPNHLESLLVAVYHQDMLIARHVLKLITCVSTWEAAQFLFAYLLECHQDILDDRVLKELMVSLRPLSSEDLWPALISHLEERFSDRVPSSLAKLRASGPAGGAESITEVETLRNWARGTVEPFLLDILTVLLEGRTSRLPAVFTDAAAGMQARARQAPYALDTCATGLESMVGRGFFVSEDVIDLLFQSFMAQTGREATARVLGALVKPTDTNYLEGILATHDSTLRAAALDGIAVRQDVAFLTFLLRACRDPIEDVAGRMILALGNLEGAAEQASALIGSRAPEDVALGLRIARMNRMTSLVGQIMAFLETNAREDSSIDAVALLGEFGTVDEGLLKQLHSGQSARMQSALAVALAGRGPTTTALELARVALTLRQPEVWLAAAEGMIQAWAAVGPMPAEVSEQLMNLVQACWGERSPGPWRVRLIQALQGYQGVDRVHAESLFELVAACADDKRAQYGWGPEQQNQLAVTIRHLRRGVEGTKV